METVLIDIGPAVGRRTHARYGIGRGAGVIYGSMVTYESDHERHRRVAKAWKAANPELSKERERAWYQANREKALAQQKARRAR